jgi:prolyl-tRNA synthetase
MRGREFIMKDAYSFHVSPEDVTRTYEAMYRAYERIFRRCGLDFRAVEADSGAIGGSRNHEFQVLADSGEDAIVSCDRCDYAANVEQAELTPPVEPGITGTGPLTRCATPAVRTIEEVASFFKVAPRALIKTLVYMADGKPVAVLVRGDRAVNEIKLKKLLGVVELYLAREGQVVDALGVPPGFAGPVGAGIPVYADEELRGATGAICGANEKDAHYTGVDLERDAPVSGFAPLRLAEAGDRCARCKEGSYRAFRGIEVGHVFDLGNRYSEPMGCTFLDEAGATRTMYMGCYGIGVTRVAAAAIEQNHDADGIRWPLSIAPFEVTVLPLQANDPEVVAAAEALYQELGRGGVEVLLDDREERPGAKFKDADLIGIPLRVAIGKRSLKDGVVEIKWRRDAEASTLPAADAGARIAELVAGERRRLEAV